MIFLGFALADTFTFARIQLYQPPISRVAIEKSNSPPAKTMIKTKRNNIEVQGIAIAILDKNNQEYISLTDIARYRDSQEPFAIINNWIRGRSTIELLGLWEKLSNPDFKPLEFERFKNEAGSNYFVLSPQRWIEATKAIGIISKSGRYGGTFAHKDIAFEFASWISVEFKLYLIKEFQRLKNDENDRLQLGWNLQRTLAKINYRIHTDAIKETLIPPAVSKAQANAIYASEADLLNVALFGQTAVQWRDTHPDAKGNIRDHAPLDQLVVLTNLESLNSVLIRQGLPAAERLLKLNEIAINQMRTLLGSNSLKRLK